MKVPQRKGANKVSLLRAANGHLLAACRTDVPRRLTGKTLDHYEGLGVSISKDDGQTWSAVKTSYDYGRHHPSLVLMPNQDIVMTYVVRLGYVDDRNGFPQFGIEAIVSHDHGVTWDLDHCYLLRVWSGKKPVTPTGGPAARQRPQHCCQTAGLRNGLPHSGRRGQPAGSSKRRLGELAAEPGTGQHRKHDPRRTVRFQPTQCFRPERARLRDIFSALRIIVPALPDSG